MTFDYRRFLVILFLTLSALSGIEGLDDYKESDERIRRLEEYITNEILTYLRLLRLENEQRARFLEQNRQNGGQQVTDYMDSDWLESSYDYDFGTDWLQDSYNMIPYPGQFGLWRNSPLANNKKFVNSPVIGRQSKIPNGGKLKNSMSPMSYDIGGINSMPASIQTSHPFQPSGQNYNNMKLYNVNKPPNFKIDQFGKVPLPVVSNDYNFKFGQLPNIKKPSSILLGGFQDESGYQFPSNIAEPQAESMAASSPTHTKPSSVEMENNVAPASVRSLNVPTKKQTIKSSNLPPSNNSGVIDFSTSTSGNIFETDGRVINNIPKMKVQETKEIVNSARDNSNIAGGIKQGNKKYKVLLVDGDSAKEVNLDEMHEKLFSVKGDDSTGALKTTAMTAAASSNSGGEPQHSFQAVSISNDGGMVISSPTTKSTKAISRQRGSAEDGSTTTTTVFENQPRDLGLQYNTNSGFGSFNKVNNILPTTGFQAFRFI